MIFNLKSNIHNHLFLQTSPISRLPYFRCSAEIAEIIFSRELCSEDGEMPKYKHLIIL